MDSPSVKAVMEMGYSRDIIREAIHVKLSTTGVDTDDKRFVCMYGS